MRVGTRGVYGFRKGGTDKVTYNHSYSEPQYVGMNILEFIQQTSDAEMNSIFERIILVNENAVPPQEAIDDCKKFFALSEASPKDWYHLLNNIQGNLLIYKQGLTYMIDNKDFLKDTTFCEWGYILELDKRQLEVMYQGFFHKSYDFLELRRMKTCEEKQMWANELEQSAYEIE